MDVHKPKALGYPTYQRFPFVLPEDSFGARGSRIAEDCSSETMTKRASPITTKFVRCDLCGSEDQDLLYSKIDPFTGEEFHLVECSCGMAFVNPMPTEESIPFLYPGDYLKDKSLMGSLYRRMMGYLPQTETGRLLDVGCGRGDFLQFAATQGWEVDGVDLLDWGSPDQLPLRVGDFLKMDLPQRSYDAITAWALLEHVRRPSAFFAKVSSLLADDGYFVFVVPNFGAPGMRYSCTDDIPRHLHLFTERAIDAYLHSYGMRVQKVHHSSALYTAYPFGILRHKILRLLRGETNCSRYENRSVALLRSRQLKGNLVSWLKEVLTTVTPFDMLVDVIDLALAIVIAKVSKLVGNYGVITVIAVPDRQKKSNPIEEDC